jgi:predicted RNase H-like nuclease (RuvC/YqgF family)
MSTTPRTDKWMHEQECNFDVPWEEHCQTLETELNACRKKLAQVTEAYEAFERTADFEATHCANLLHAANARIAELEQELAMSKREFEAMALAFTEERKQ